MIDSREKLEAWLKDRPAEYAQVIAARVALRALPYAFDERIKDNQITRLSFVLFHANFMSWAACNFPARYTAFAAVRAAAAARAVTDTIEYAAAPHATLNAAADAANAALDAHAARYAASAAANAERVAANALSHLRSSGLPFHLTPFHLRVSVRIITQLAVWASVSTDCDWLDGSTDPAPAARRLTREPLWPRSAPQGWNQAWKEGKARLLDIDPSYDVWTGWYDRRIIGNRASFDIPGDTDRIEDKKILARLADAADEDFWSKGATYVNTTLQGWIDEARERMAAQAPDDSRSPPLEAIRAIAAEIASPSVMLTNNQLDVIANAAFDDQTNAADLHEAIEILQAVVKILLGSLPGNAPRSFEANLTIYGRELAKRAAKPFLGVLVRMENSISAGFQADPEMFDASVTANFESFFEAHLAFMSHYRRNAEREAITAQFKIDDAAASGAALTGPVDEIVKEIAALAAQGLVTEAFAQAIKEQKAFNDEVALYTPARVATSGDLTLKKRHILQTIGFYERALAAVNDVVSGAAQFGPFAMAAKEVIDMLAGSLDIYNEFASINNNALSNSRISVWLKDRYLSLEHSSSIPVTGNDSSLENEPQSISLFFATCREADINGLEYFTHRRASECTYGIANIHIPIERNFGSLRRPRKLSIFSVTLFEMPENARTHFIINDVKIMPIEIWRKQIDNFNSDEALIFVHGFNITFRDALYRAAQIFHDLQYGGTPILFSWASGGRKADYLYDKDSANVGEKYLIELLAEVASTGIKKVHILAHSMGNALVIAALEKHNHKDNPLGIVELMMAAPDVDCDVYGQKMPELCKAIPGLTLYASATDNALALSKTLARNKMRAGEISNGQPVLIEGVDAIDITEIGSEIFGLGHGAYASAPSILNDIGQLVNHRQRPPSKRLSQIRGMPEGATTPKWWKFIG